MTASKTTGFLRRPASRGRTQTAWSSWDTAEIVLTSFLRPVIVTAAVCAAALASIPAAHADSPGVGNAMAPVLNGGGIGNTGPVGGVIAQMGQSICPMLVKPGGSLATGAAQMSGHGGLEAPMAGFLAQMAIQSQCPGWINSVANGNMPFPLPGAGGPGLPLGLGAPAPQPRPFPGL